MISRLIVLTDLDDTWFMSHRSLPAGASREHLAAVDREGEPLSFQTTQQHVLWTLLQRAADILIPVTGRTSYAIDRVTMLPKGGYAVSSHGALVTHDGSLLPAWTTTLAPHLDRAKHTLERAKDWLELLASEQAPEAEVGFRVLHDLEVPVYLSVKSPHELPGHFLTAIRDVSERLGLRLHANTRNAALRPPYTCKAAACRFLLEQVLERQPDDTVITLGDSLSDLDFMGAGDMAMVPTDSQIWAQLKELAQ